MKIYLVGGAVRDQLLNRPVKDRDWVVVGETPETMIKAGFRPIGKDFPVFLHPKTQEEYALARTERKVSRGYTGFEFHASPDVTLEEDLARRDLTINAIAMSESGEVVDPYQGKKDLENKILRHVSPAFSEDPVRILRLARFMARFGSLGFHVANETAMLMREMVESGEVDALVPERVWQELQRALCESSPEKFFETLRLCGALKKLMPELDKLFGIPNPTCYHPEIDTGIHTLMVLQQATCLSDDPEIRFAALLHDLGKGATDLSKWPSHHGHDHAGVPYIKAFCNRFKVPKVYRDLARIACEYHTACHRSMEFLPKTLLKLFEKTDAIRRPDRFKKVLIVCQADSQGRPGFEDHPFVQRDFLLKKLEKVKQVDISSLIDEGLEGMKLVNAIRKMRINAIK